MRTTLVAITMTALLSCVSSQRLIAQPQQESPQAKGHGQDGFVAQKLTPFATEVSRPKEWFFWQDNTGGNFTWIISKNELGKENRQFDTGVEIKAFYDVSKKTKTSPEDFAAEYLKTSTKSLKSEEMKIIHQAKQKAGPLTALTQTVELANGLLATDLYWGDGKQLDVMVVVKRRAPKDQWNANQRLFNKLTRFNLRTIVEGTRDKPRIDDSKQK